VGKIIVKLIAYEGEVKKLPLGPPTDTPLYIRTGPELTAYKIFIEAKICYESNE